MKIGHHAVSIKHVPMGCVQTKDLRCESNVITWHSGKTAPSLKWESCWLHVIGLQYRTLTKCMYWFPPPFQLDSTIQPIHRYREKRKRMNKNKQMWSRADLDFNWESASAQSFISAESWPTSLHCFAPLQLFCDMTSRKKYETSHSLWKLPVKIIP